MTTLLQISTGAGAPGNYISQEILQNDRGLRDPDESRQPSATATEHEIAHFPTATLLLFKRAVHRQRRREGTYGKWSLYRRKCNKWNMTTSSPIVQVLHVQLLAVPKT